MGRVVKQEEIEHAARQANIHDLIISLADVSVNIDIALS
jgi:ABC-type multidrug transport system fused ATPase/permease subunit